MTLLQYFWQALGLLFYVQMWTYIACRSIRWKGLSKTRNARHLDLLFQLCCVAMRFSACSAGVRPKKGLHSFVSPDTLILHLCPILLHLLAYLKHITSIPSSSPTHAKLVLATLNTVFSSLVGRQLTQKVGPKSSTVWGDLNPSMS